MRPKTPLLPIAVLALTALAGPARAGQLGLIDCNNDGIFSVREISVVLNVALGKMDLTECPSADINGDGFLRVDEVVDAAVVASFGGGAKARRIDAPCTDGAVNVGGGALASLDLPAPGLVMGSASGPAGGQVQIDMDLATMGQPVVAAQNDIIFDPAVVDVSGTSPCTSLVAEKLIATDVITCPGPASDPCPAGNDGKKRLRVILVGTSSPTALITDGSALYRCRFTISAAAPTGSTPLNCANAIAALYGNPPTPTLSPTATLTGLATATPSVTPPPPSTATATIAPTATVPPPTATATAVVNTRVPTSTARSTSTSVESTPTATAPHATATATAAASAVCVGDCNGDHRVLIDELVRSVAIALDRLEASVCPAIDCHGTGTVTVDCLIRAVNAALGGCPT